MPILPEETVPGQECNWGDTRLGRNLLIAWHPSSFDASLTDREKLEQVRGHDLLASHGRWLEPPLVGVEDWDIFEKSLRRSRTVVVGRGYVFMMAQSSENDPFPEARQFFDSLVVSPELAGSP